MIRLLNLTKIRLRYEILIVIALKLALLYGLWALCFSDPVKKHLSHQDVAHHVVTSSS